MAHDRRGRSSIISKLTVGLAAALIGLSVTAGQPAQSDSLLIDNIERSQTQPQKMPARGMSMDKVENMFGSPSVRHQAVGDPPISRWEYNNFVVYFEYRHVIHTVPKRRQARAN